MDAFFYERVYNIHELYRSPRVSRILFCPRRGDNHHPHPPIGKDNR